MNNPTFAEVVDDITLATRLFMKSVGETEDISSTFVHDSDEPWAGRQPLSLLCLKLACKVWHDVVMSAPRDPLLARSTNHPMDKMVSPNANSLLAIANTCTTGGVTPENLEQVAELMRKQRDES